MGKTLQEIIEAWECNFDRDFDWFVNDIDKFLSGFSPVPGYYGVPVYHFDYEHRGICVGYRKPTVEVMLQQLVCHYKKLGWNMSFLDYANGSFSLEFNFPGDCRELDYFTKEKAEKSTQKVREEGRLCIRYGRKVFYAKGTSESLTEPSDEE